MTAQILHPEGWKPARGYANGMMGDKGLGFLMGLNMFSPFLTQLLPGVFYFFGLQAVSKVLLIMLDVEDNTRRSARK